MSGGKRAGIFAGFVFAMFVIWGGGVFAQSVPPNINYQGRLFDAGGQPVTGTVPMTFSLWDRAVTQDPVDNESVTMAGTSAIPLMHQNLVSGSVMVTAVGGAPVYESPRDYTIDAVNGTITRVAGGFILDGTVVEVDYTWTNQGTMAWSESQAVPVDGGLYSVVLGAYTPIPAAVFGGADVFLEVTVNGETLSPRARLTSVPYAFQTENAYQCAEADFLDGFDSTEFALAFHSHDASEIASGTVGTTYYSSYADLVEEGYLDNSGPADIITQGQGDGRYSLIGHGHSFDDLAGGEVGTDYYSAYADLGAEGYLDNNDPADLLTQAQSDPRFVNTTGDDAMAGSFQIGGNLGLGTPPQASYGVINNWSVPPQYGANFTGSVSGVKGVWSGNFTTFGLLGAELYGVQGQAGKPTDTVTRMGGYFTAYTAASPYGVLASATGYGSDPAYAVYGSAYGNSTGDSYGGYFWAGQNGSVPGLSYGIYAGGGDFAAWLDSSPVHIGYGGVMNFIDGNGDLYIQDEIEVDGIAHFSGGIDAPAAIDPADVSFNYAGSSSQGGPASDLACYSCITAEEIEPYTVISEIIYEDGAGSNLDADLLDGQHGSYYQNAGNINGGSLNAAYFSAYSDLTAEGYLDNNAVADILTRSQSDARFSPLTHNHSAADINTGTLGASYYSAYSDLTAEGYLDNNAAGDLLTQTQGDGRFVNTTGDDSMSGSLTMGGDLTVNGGNIGLGASPSLLYGVVNNSVSAPTYGAYLYGFASGLYGLWSSDPTDHYGYLGSQNYGALARAGNSDETGDRYGAHFSAHTQDNARGVYALAYGYGSSPAVGGDFTTGTNGTGAHYGVRGFGNSSTASGALSYGVWGQGSGFASASTNYGGYFTTQGSGTRYGVYGQGYTAGGVFTYQGDTAMSRVTLATSTVGASISNGSPSAAMTRTGINVAVQTAGGYLYGAYYDLDSYATLNYPAYGNHITVNMHNNPYIGYGVYATVDGGTASATQYGVVGRAFGNNGGASYGLFGYAQNSAGTAYGLYANAAVSDDYAGYFGTGKVRIGTAGTAAYNTGSGDLYAADAIEAGGDFYYSADKVRYFTVSRVGEWDGSSGRSWDPGSTGSICPDATTCGTYYAVNLPDRATVTAFRVWGSTASTSHSFNCYLFNSTVTSGVNTAMATVQSSNTAMTLADTSITSPDVDNANYGYMVYCYEGTTSRGAYVNLYGIRIDYTVDGPE